MKKLAIVIPCYNEEQALPYTFEALVCYVSDAEAVENSTNFIDAVGRASNIEADIPKFMIIPERRKQELLNYKDSMFVNSFFSIVTIPSSKSFFSNWSNF